ncbi:nucleolar GTP-binding protein 2 [Trichonephila clavipes]|nr:nucleolar GTP-binding protein 2 [Trichonephila clavipes]
MHFASYSVIATASYLFFGRKEKCDLNSSAEINDFSAPVSHKALIKGPDAAEITEQGTKCVNLRMVWQYITLMRRIYLIDCPGVVYPSGNTDTEIVLKGVVRVENVKDPEDHIPELMNRVKKEYLERTYNIIDWKDPTDFLEQYAHKTGKLLKGGEPDLPTVAKMILNDFQRGKLPYFVKPPIDESKIESISDNTEENRVVETVANEEKSENSANIDEDKEKESTETSNENSNDPSALEDQDFSELKLGIEFDKDDLKPLSEDVDNKKTGKSASNGDCPREGNNADNKKTEESEETGKSASNGDGSQEGNVLDSEEKNIESLEKTKCAPSDGENSLKRKGVLNNRSKKRKKRKHDDEMEPTMGKKLTSRQKRRIMRQEKKRKIGFHFYKEKNVKNRNLNRRQRDL